MNRALATATQPSVATDNVLSQACPYTVAWTKKTQGEVAGVWLVSLVKQQEQILLHRKGSLHDAVEVRLLRGSFCTSVS